MEAVECGAASLSMILQFYGRFVPLEQLRIDCGVSRDGSNAFNVLRAAEKYGLKGSGQKRTFEELREDRRPVILFWEYKHFLVLEGFGRNKVFLNDPGVGRRHVTFDEFKKSYSGIALSFEKTDLFVKGGQPPTLIRQIWHQIKIVPSPIMFVIISGFFLLLPGFAMPAFLMAFINTFFTQNVIVWRGEFVVAVFLMFLFSACLNWMRKYYLNRLGIHLSLVFSSNYLWHLLKLPISFYHQRYSSEIAYRQRLNDSVAKTLTQTLISSFIDLFLIVFYALLMFMYDPAIAWIGLLAGICSFAVLLIIYQTRVNAYARLQQNTAKMVAKGMSGLQQIESIKAMGSESDFFSTWAGTFTNAFNDRQEIGKKDVMLNTLPLFFQIFAGAVLLSLGSKHVIDGTLSIGMLMAMQILQTNFLAPISRFVSLNQMIQSMKIDMDRLNDVFKNPVDPYYKESEEPIQELKGHLEFRNVSFSYAPLSLPSIENVSFEIQPGKRVALVGPTGSGKSTIAKLSSRLLTPTTGEIFLDGVPMTDIPREVLYKTLATVDQDIFLFSGTIRENITLWNPEVAEEGLIHASKDAQIHEEIVLRKDNYDSMLYEGGKNLSGGQKQRLEIARGLLHNPPLLILDEAMSALDSKLEKEILHRIALRGCSCLMISHRLSTIQDCDEIIVLDRGKIVQRGHHTELKGAPGVYQDLILSESL